MGELRDGFRKVTTLFWFGDFCVDSLGSFLNGTVFGSFLKSTIFLES